ncbi:MAG: hypothetical protein L0229_16825 [Blastocatellia bacterium]|nr:hypothetical protein [Blastocatellia bacterium]
MDHTEEESRSASTERLNYFNYFTEVEEEFVRRRGKPLLVSPMDWALIESWKNAGIPLHVVLRAINQAFDSYDARPRKYRKVNSVFYCQQEVESTFAEYRLSQVGASSETAELPAEARPRKSRSKRESSPAFPKDVLLEFLTRSDAELAQAATLVSGANRPEVEEAVKRARTRLAEIAVRIESAEWVDEELLERDLDSIDRMILKGLTADCGQQGIEALRREAQSQLRPYHSKMDESIYRQTVENFISRRLRETHRIPRLSLFYI